VHAERSSRPNSRLEQDWKPCGDTIDDPYLTAQGYGGNSNLFCQLFSDAVMPKREIANIGAGRNGFYEKKRGDA
jgi:hypothetical protein